VEAVSFGLIRSGSREVWLIRHRFGACVALLALVALLAGARQAGAAAEVHRLNVVLSATPTQITPKAFNGQLALYNRDVLSPRGIEGIKKISFGWLFDSEVRYFIRQNWAVSGGVGQLRRQSRREVLPALQQDIQLRAELLSVPIHVGAAYYFRPYNQGDFQARAYLGGGVVSSVYNFGRFQAVESGTDSSTTLGGTYQLSARGDSPGYYVETGFHLFFATRYSVMVGAAYRKVKIREAEGTLRTNGQEIPLGPIFDLDTSGVGVKLALAVGL
jgi:hypothetical protein